MTEPNSTRSAAVSLTTLAAGAGGAALGYVLSFPAFVLTGPALLVSLLGLAGIRMDIDRRLRDVAFVVVGVGIGSTVTASTAEALLRWPLAFVALAIMLAATMWLSQWCLKRFFGFDARSAVLASAPGHLSFVIALSTQMNVDVLRVTIVQSLRLLSLTLIVPLVARLVGVEISGTALSGNGVLSLAGFSGLVCGGAAAGLVIGHLGVPAGLLIGAMMVSAVAHGAGWVHGGLPPWLATVAFIVLGTMIGTRFSGMSFQALIGAAGAGAITTLLASILTVIAALALLPLLGMPFSTLLTGFAPGGFETMIALSAVLGANPGFVAACHVARLMILTGLIPLVMRLAVRTS